MNPTTRFPRRRAGAALAALSLASLGFASGCAAPGPAVAAVDQQIRYYERALDDDPGLYPVHAQLGAAWLERARLTHDPEDVQRARDAARRSLELQSNFAALATMTSVANFAHRFEEALDWGGRAAGAAPQETGVTVELVDAYLGLGRRAEAARLVPPLGKIPPDFNLSVARARVLAAERQVDQSVEAYVWAAGEAVRASQPGLAAWARTSAAGVLLDAGRPDDALAHLDAAADLDPDARLLRLHLAELLMARQRYDEALEIQEGLLREASDPTVHAAAWLSARAAGRTRTAQRHFDAARAGFQKAIEAGEVYTLGSLALLYLTAGTNSDEARDLARRHLEHTRTDEARALLSAAGGG